MSRLIINQARMLTLAAKNQCRLRTEINIPRLDLSKIPRHFSSAIDEQLNDKGIKVLALN